MTEKLFLTSPYLAETDGTVTAITEDGGIVVDRTVFYAQGGGQPGDTGALAWDGGRCDIVNTVKGGGDDIVLIPREGADLPPAGAEVTQKIDWDRRHRLMRVHTALHLLSVVIPLPVTGGSIGEGKGRLDFDMPEAPEDKAALQQELDALVGADYRVTEDWITDEELAAKPELVKTMSVKPPSGAGRVRLIRIGTDDGQVDLQPCGGTHVASTAEIGRAVIGKIEKKGRQNRRVTVTLE
ncbi:MAG: alanyl-tRNA editing protein [Rhodobacter sp.]|nr:alanyl-tRNA editing protein [Rhodobacter sp.]